MRKNESRGIGRGKTTPMKPCDRCGRGSHLRDKCPTKDATCHRCEKKGYFSSQCVTKQVADIKSEMEAAFLGTITDKQALVWYTTVQLNQRRTQFKLDTGAELTAISKKTYENLRKVPLTKSERVLYGPSRQPLNTVGEFGGTIAHRGKTSKQRVFVVEGLKTNLRVFQPSLP